VFTYLVELHDKKLAAGTLGADLPPLSSQPAAAQQHNHTGVATASAAPAAAPAAPAAQPAAGALAAGGSTRQRSNSGAAEGTGTLGMSPLTASRKRIDATGKPAATAAAADKGPATPAAPAPAGSSHMPAEVVLQPTTRRGKKGFKHKLNKAKAKLGGEACTIM
jgi:hypothetical protein